MTLSLDRVLPSSTPDSWDLAEVFAYGIGYGLYLTLSTIIFWIVIYSTTFFEDTFSVNPIKDVGSREGHMIIYLQVAIISQALIFVTRSHSFSWMERPSYALMGAFCIAQLIASIIAAYGDWVSGYYVMFKTFTNILGLHPCCRHRRWMDRNRLGGESTLTAMFLTTQWNIIWYFPLDLVKFALKYSVIAWLQRRKAAKVPPALTDENGELLQRTTSRHESLYVSDTFCHFLFSDH